jgi:hypothetical protein
LDRNGDDNEKATKYGRTLCILLNRTLPFALDLDPHRYGAIALTSTSKISPSLKWVTSVLEAVGESTLHTHSFTLGELTKFNIQPDMSSAACKMWVMTLQPHFEVIMLTRGYIGDELRPTCKACSKKNRPCQWDAPQNKFKAYQPDAESSKSASGDVDASSDAMDVDSSEGGIGEGHASSSAFSSEEQHKEAAVDRRNSRTASRSDGLSSVSGQHSPGSVSLPQSGSRPAIYGRDSGSGSGSGSGSASGSATQMLSQIPPGTRQYSKTPIPLTHDEAVLVHHYTEYLGRWLDCTDAMRQFTLGVPRKVKLCPVLCHAVLSFAARHRKEDTVAEAAYQRCIALLINRLNEDAASHDETLLCAIVILRYYEQLSGE